MGVTETSPGVVNVAEKLESSWEIPLVPLIFHVLLAYVLLPKLLLNTKPSKNIGCPPISKMLGIETWPDTLETPSTLRKATYSVPASAEMLGANVLVSADAVTGMVYNTLLTPEPFQTPTPPIRLPMGERKSIVNDESVPVMGAVNNSPNVVVGGH